MRSRPGASHRASVAALLAALAWSASGCAIGVLDDSGEDGSSEPGAGRDPGTAACAEVKAGVDAFNEGDFTESVARFRAAVPLAEERAEEYPSRRADLLLEAVRWYADLPPEDYPEASRESERFARYQRITLAQCVVGSPGDEDSPGEEDSSGGVDV